MIGKLIGAVIGERVARRSGISGTGGVLLGAAVPPLVRRFGPVGLVAAAAGGYALKRLHEKRQRRGFAGMGVPL
jgi:hypothetical protein